MQHRNYILFVILSMGILVGWQTFVLPLLLPKKPVAKNVAQQPEKPNPQKAAASAPGKPDTAKPDATPAVVKANEADAKKDAKNKETAKSDEKRSGEKQPAAAAAKTKEPPVFEHKTISIGSLDPTTGYFLRVDLDSKGAAVSSIELNDPRYRDLKNDKLPLKLVGNDFDLRFLKLLEDRDNAQSEQRTIVQVVKEAEAGVESARDTVTHLAKEVEPGGAARKTRLLRPSWSGAAPSCKPLKRNSTDIAPSCKRPTRSSTVPSATPTSRRRLSIPTSPTSTPTYQPVKRILPAATGRWTRSPAIRTTPASIQP